MPIVASTFFSLRRRRDIQRHAVFCNSTSTDLNAERCAVRHQLLQFLFGVHPFMGNSVAHAFFPFGGDAFEFGVAGHRKTPPLVVRQVDLELVEFVVGHHIHKFFQIGRGDEMPRGIHHEAAPRIARLVRDDAAGNALVQIFIAYQLQAAGLNSLPDAARQECRPKTRQASLPDGSACDIPWRRESGWTPARP